MLNQPSDTPSPHARDALPPVEARNREQWPCGPQIASTAPARQREKRWLKRWLRAAWRGDDSLFRPGIPSSRPTLSCAGPSEAVSPAHNARGPSAPVRGPSRGGRRSVGLIIRREGRFLFRGEGEGRRTRRPRPAGGLIGDLRMSQAARCVSPVSRSPHRKQCGWDHYRRISSAKPGGISWRAPYASPVA